MQRRTTAQRRRCVSSQSLCRCTLNCRFSAHLVGRIVSGVRISASFQFSNNSTARGSVRVRGVRVSVSFQSCALRMFVCPVFSVLSAVPCVRKVIFLSLLSCHVLGDPQWRRCAPLRVFYGPVCIDYEKLT